MSDMALTHGDPNHLRGMGESAMVHDGPAPKRIVTGYGFWIFLLSDIVMFSCFFASYAVLVGQTAGGPHGSQLFDLKNVAVETGCLLLSSFTCGLASIAADMRNQRWFQAAMAVTCLLGLVFLALEGREFADLVARGAGPTRSAFLSSFFALVGCHGLHVSAGILWLLTMMAQVFAKGFRADIMRRLLCFALFWHALDIIWVAVFSVVYLLGSAV
jgi:cytochrome o ubiquinol oxidase subunit 3